MHSSSELANKKRSIYFPMLQHNCINVIHLYIIIWSFTKHFILLSDLSCTYLDITRNIHKCQIQLSFFLKTNMAGIMG